MSAKSRDWLTNRIRQSDRKESHPCQKPVEKYTKDPDEFI